MFHFFNVFIFHYIYVIHYVLVHIHFTKWWFLNRHMGKCEILNIIWVRYVQVSKIGAKNLFQNSLNVFVLRIVILPTNNIDPQKEHQARNGDNQNGQSENEGTWPLGWSLREQTRFGDNGRKSASFRWLGWLFLKNYCMTFSARRILP